jgi:LPXTG-site transpeptidase (sortase) family protein
MLIHNNHKLNSARRAFRIVAAVLSILVIALTLLILSTKIAKSDPVLFTKTDTQIAQVNLPVRLEIPSINVDTSIYYVGLNSDGAMDINKQDTTQVAWYQPGTIPGNIGSAVIAGHYGWLASGEGSVFNNLQYLKKDDIIMITNNKGDKLVFTVRESQKYDPDANADKVFKSGDNKAHLNLITCYGEWINAKNTYSDRLVVFADKK